MLGWFRRAKVEAREVSPSNLSSPQQWLLETWGRVTTSGVAVSPTTAMRVPAVAAAVLLLSSTVATLPCKLFRRAEGGKSAHGVAR
jgi:phage portal protein BeeE